MKFMNLVLVAFLTTNLVLGNSNLIESESLQSSYEDNFAQLEDIVNGLDPEQPLTEDQQENDLAQSKIQKIIQEQLASHSNIVKKPPFYINNLYSRRISVSADMTIFAKSMKMYWESIITSQPMKRGFVTEIDIKMLTNHHQIFGFANKNKNHLTNQWIGKGEYQASYSTLNGYSYNLAHWRPYGSSLSTGDVLTSKIDLREGHFTIEFLKNGHSMGLAFAGLEDWNEKIYWGASLHYLGSMFQILAIREYKE